MSRDFRKVKLILFIILALSAFLALLLILFSSLNDYSVSEVKIGYFFGGRTALFYRTYINGCFGKEGIKINLLTKTLYGDSFNTVPKKFEDIEDIEWYGKAEGEILINEIMNGNFDGAVIGESSLIEAASMGLPIVAVTELGHDLKDRSGHAIIFRSDVVINKPEDIKGKNLVTRRAGPGDKMMLREFLRSVGLDPKTDVTILDNLPEDEVIQRLQDKSIDGGYYHIYTIKKLVESGVAYVYRKLDWLNPELSHAVLVFHKDFVEKYPQSVEKIVRAYMKRSQFEKNLSPEERVKDQRRRKGVDIEMEFQGLSIPGHDFPPLVSLELLNEMQNLLLKYEYIDRAADLKNFIDNSFVEKIYAEIK